MAFWSWKKKRKPPTSPTADASIGDAPTAATDPPAAPASAPAAAEAPASAPAAVSTPAAAPPATTLSAMNAQMLAGIGAASPPTDALNQQIVQAVQLSNAENASYAPTQIALGPNMMISQASGLVAQSAAAYFDGVSKLALASQSVLLKEMTENLVENKLAQAAEDALGVLATDLLMGAAAAVAAAAGAIEAEAASFAIDKIDQSISKYASVLESRKSPN